MKTIIELANGNAALLRKMVADVDPGDMCKQPNGVVNHAAWQTGHITFVRSIVVGMLGGTPTVPESWGLLFAPNTQPAADASKYPSKSELTTAYDETHKTLMAAIAAAPDSLLDGPHPVEPLKWLFPTMRHFAAGVVTTHDCLHLGQLSVWRRQLGLPRVI
jgi:hypothetical protein